MATKEAAPSVQFIAEYEEQRRRINAHEEDKVRRAAEREKKRKTQLKCLDPTTAAWYESRKTVYTWKIEVSIFRPAKKGQRAKMENFSEEVPARNDSEAWAVFCDRIGEWPSRRDSAPTITKLSERGRNDD